MLVKIGLMAAAGALGTLARAGVTSLVQRAAGLGFPWGTVTVNLLGCFLFGLAFALLEQRAAIFADARLVVLTGFMGAFTTFSTYAFDVSALFTSGRTLAALANVTLQNIAGVVVLMAGLALGRAL
jgi:CrcB protein